MSIRVRAYVGTVTTSCNLAKLGFRSESMPFIQQFTPQFFDANFEVKATT